MDLTFTTPSEDQRYIIGRYEVPIDGDWHTIKLSGGITGVGNRTPSVVEFWALNAGDREFGVEREFTVVGTGHPLPSDCRLQIVGTVISDNHQFVWHLIEKKK